MRNAGVIALSAVLALAACKDETKSTTTTTASSTQAVASAAAPTTTMTAAATATVQAAAVTVSPEMTAFMGMLDGKDGSSRKALKKYGSVAGIQTDDLGMYMLQNPKVTKSEKSGDLQCYTMETEAGIMKHVTQVCWDSKGKISKLSDTSS